MTGRGWAGLLWENKYYGRSNFVIFISPGSMCVLLDRTHYTNTSARMHTFRAREPKLSIQHANMHTHKRWNTHPAAEISTHTHTHTEANPYLLYNTPSPILWLCLHVCVCAFTRVRSPCQRVTECSNDHSPDTGILTAASFHRHFDWRAISYAGVKN